MIRTASAAILALFWVLLAIPAQSDEPSHFSFSSGWFDFNDNVDSVDFRFEYRSNYKLLGFLKPWAGIEANSDGALYPLAGVLTDIYFGRRWVLTPSFGAGIYARHDSKDLGSDFEFRSQLEYGYRFDDWSRLTIAVSHISNASLSNTNPGTEILSVYYHLPIGK